MSKIKEMKKRILEDVEQEIDTLIKSSGGSPRSLYELEMKIAAIGERAKKRIAKEIIQYQQDQDSKKKLSEMRQTAL